MNDLLDYMDRRPDPDSMRALVDGYRRPRSDIERQWLACHQEHPEIYTHFKRFTRDLLGKGYDHGSAKMIFERIRWETMMRPTDRLDGQPLKLNNNYHAYYSRLWMEDHPEHAGFFRTREVA